MGSSDIFAMVFDNAGVAMLLLDKASGRVIEANRAYLEICGRSHSQVLGLDFCQPPLVADRELGAEIAAQLQLGAQLERVILPLEKADGSLVLLEVSGREQPGGVIQLEAQDTTAREGARLAERLDAQRRLATHVGAEFAEVERALQGAGQMLVDCALRGHSTFREADEVRKAAERAGNISRELAAYGGQLRLQPEAVQLNQLIESCEPTLRRSLGAEIKIVLDLDPEAAPALADLAQVRQIIFKLATNASEAMGRGGVFCIQTRNAPAEDPALRSPAAHTPFVILAISDNGPGLDDASWEHLYEPFFTTKPGGKRGLGLASVHGVVRQTGGHVWVKSEPGQGTSFRIYLPQAVPAPSAVPNGRAHRCGAPTILLVESNNGLRTVITNILRKRGYRVLAAREAQEALEMARTEGAPDLLINLNGSPVPTDTPNPTLSFAKPFELEPFLEKVRELLSGVE